MGLEAPHFRQKTAYSVPRVTRDTLSNRERIRRAVQGSSSFNSWQPVLDRMEELARTGTRYGAFAYTPVPLEQVSELGLDIYSDHTSFETQ